MNTLIKNVSVAGLFVWGLGLSVAQTVEPIKSGDVLNWKITVLTAVGRDVVDGAETTDASPVKIDAATGDRIYAYPAGAVRRSKLFAVLQRGDRVLQANRSFSYLPSSLAVGEKWKHTTYAGSDRCGRIKYDYEAASTQGPDVMMKIKGVPTTLKTMTVIHEGLWYSAACGGSGRAYLKYIFSPALHELVHMEYRYFYNDSLTSGGREVVTSID